MLSARCGGAQPQADALIELSPPFNGTTRPLPPLLQYYECVAQLKQVLAVFDVLMRRYYIEDELGRRRRRHQRRGDFILIHTPLDVCRL